MVFRRILTVLPLGAILTMGCQRAQPAPAWEVSLDGVGPVKFGTTPEQAAAALKTSTDSDTSGCHLWRPAGAPPGLSLMFEDGKVVRVDVDSPGVVSREGVQVGASVASAMAALGPKASITPHKYEYDAGWKYLTLESADSTHGIVVEVDSHTVRTYRAGLWPAVGYVEHCS